MLERLHVAVPVLAWGGEREPPPLNDGGMVQLVADDIILSPGDARHHAQVHLKSGGVDHHLLLAYPLGQLVLQLQVQVDGAVEETRPGAPRAILTGGIHRGLYHARVVGEAQVGVGTEHQHSTAFDNHFGVLLALNATEVGVHPFRFNLLRQVVACHAFT